MPEINSYQSCHAEIHVFSTILISAIDAQWENGAHQLLTRTASSHFELIANFIRIPYEYIVRKILHNENAVLRHAVSIYIALHIFTFRAGCVHATAIAAHHLFSSTRRHDTAINNDMGENESSRLAFGSIALYLQSAHQRCSNIFDIYSR